MKWDRDKAIEQALWATWAGGSGGAVATAVTFGADLSDVLGFAGAFAGAAFTVWGAVYVEERRRNTDKSTEISYCRDMLSKSFGTLTDELNELSRRGGAGEAFPAKEIKDILDSIGALQMSTEAIVDANRTLSLLQRALMKGLRDAAEDSKERIARMRDEIAQAPPMQRDFSSITFQAAQLLEALQATRSLF